MASNSGPNVQGVDRDTSKAAILSRMSQRRFGGTIQPSITQEIVASARPGPTLIANEQQEVDYNSSREMDENMSGVSSSQNNQPQDVVSLHHVITQSGTQMHVKDYVEHEDMAKSIALLHGVEPMPVPPFMSYKPHQNQLRAAEQARFLAHSPFKGGFIDVAPGLSKILVATLAFHRDEPTNDGGRNMSLILAPASSCQKWVADINDAWLDGHGPNVYYVQDSSMGVHELRALDVDIVVCSIETLQDHFQAIEDFKAQIAAYRAGDRTLKASEIMRPQSCVLSPFWGTTAPKWKYKVIDEAMTVKDTQGKRHQAIQMIDAEVCLLLSGGPALEEWHDLGELLQFLDGHPFKDQKAFQTAFASSSSGAGFCEVDDTGKELLQRFLQACMVTQPTE